MTGIYSLSGEDEFLSSYVTDRPCCQVTGPDSAPCCQVTGPDSAPCCQTTGPDSAPCCQVTGPDSAPSNCQNNNDERTSAGFVEVSLEIIRHFHTAGPSKQGKESMEKAGS